VGEVVAIELPNLVHLFELLPVEREVMLVCEWKYEELPHWEQARWLVVKDVVEVRGVAALGEGRCRVLECADEVPGSEGIVVGVSVPSVGGG